MQSDNVIFYLKIFILLEKIIIYFVKNKFECISEQSVASFVYKSREQNL